MTVESALINLRIATHRLVAVTEDLERITALGRPDWICEARNAYRQADMAVADAHIDLEDAVKTELQVPGRWLCETVA